MFWDDSAQLYFNGSEYVSLTKTVDLYIHGRKVARGIDRTEVRKYLYRYFRNGSKRAKRLLKYCDRLAMAVEDGNIELQTTYEYRLHVAVV